MQQIHAASNEIRQKLPNILGLGMLSVHWSHDRHLIFSSQTYSFRPLVFTAKRIQAFTSGKIMCMNCAEVEIQQK